MSVDLAGFYTLAHPRCQRSFLLRTDITDPAQLSDGELPTPPPVTRAEVEHFRSRVAEQLADDLRREQRRTGRVDARQTRLRARAERIAARLNRRAVPVVPDDIDIQ